MLSLLNNFNPINQKYPDSKLNRPITGSLNPVNKLISFGEKLSLSTLAEDTISFNDTYFNRNNISKKVRSFASELMKLATREDLNINNIEALIKGLGLNIDVTVSDIRYKPEYNGKVAVCDTSYDHDKARTILYIDMSIEPKRLIQNLTHEFTHVLQDSTLEENAISHRAARYGGVHKFSNAFLTFEKEFIDINYIYNIAIKPDKVMKKLNNSMLDDPLNEYEFKTEELCRQYDEIFERVMKENNIKDKAFAKEFFILQAKEEAQAYEEGFRVKKQLEKIPLNHYITQDLVPKMYSDLIKYFENKP